MDLTELDSLSLSHIEIKIFFFITSYLINIIVEIFEHRMACGRRAVTVPICCSKILNREPAARTCLVLTSDEKRTKRSNELRPNPELRYDRMPITVWA